jgi:pimeloyl-ACP methyl ester carboxylesterase
MAPTARHSHTSVPVRISLRGISLDGDLVVPPLAEGIVIFAHGSGSSRLSPRNRAVAASLNAAGFATLLLDLLTPGEEQRDATTAALRFDIGLLTERLVAATDWIAGTPETADLGVGYFGASTGAAAALAAAARRPDIVRAVVSRGGRPDLARPLLGGVRAPTLLIVGGDDAPVIDLNRDAFRQLRGVRELEIVPHASHLFEEPGALEQVTILARDWYRRYLTAASPPGLAG